MPWDLVGWGSFAVAVATGAARWTGASWVTVGFIALSGLVGLGLIAAMSLSGPRD